MGNRTRDNSPCILARRHLPSTHVLRFWVRLDFQKQQASLLGGGNVKPGWCSDCHALDALLYGPTVGENKTSRSRER